MQPGLPGDDARLEELKSAIEGLRRQVTALEERLHALEGGRAKAGVREVGAVGTAFPPPLPAKGPPPLPRVPPPVPPPVQPVVLAGDGSRVGAFVQGRVAEVQEPVRAGSRPDALETAIGLKWAAWIGGLVVVLGVLFFIKYAWDQGWVSLTPTMRVMAAFATGAVMIGVGQWRLRVMRVLGAALIGGGLAIVMGAILAGHAYFVPPVIPREVAFVGVLVAGVAGVAMALQARAISLALIALVGIYIAPGVLASGRDSSVALMAYLAVVAGMALGVAYFKRRWHAVRWLALAGTWVWVYAWMFAAYMKDHPVLAPVAVAGFLGAFLMEAAASIHRSMRPVEETEAGVAESPNTVLLEGSLAGLSMLLTALAFGAVALAFYRLKMDGLWVAALGLAGIHGLLVFATPSRVFSVASAVLSVAALAVAVPLYFDGPATTITYAIMGGAAAAFATLTNRRTAWAFSLGLLLLTFLRLITFDALNRHLNDTWFVAGGQEISRWSVLAAGMAVFALALALTARLRTVQREEGAVRTGAAWVEIPAAVLGTLIFALAATATFTSGSVLTTALGVWLLGVALLAAGLRSRLYTGLSAGLAVVLLSKWVVADNLLMGATGRMLAEWEAMLPVVNLSVLDAALVICALALLPLREEFRPIRRWAVAVILFAAANFEAVRTVDYVVAGMDAATVDPWILKNVVLSVLWSVVGFACVGVGFRRDAAAIRWTGLVLLGVTTLKVLLVDMSGVETVLRVLAFIVVGVLLLGVSFLYHRFAGGRR